MSAELTRVALRHRPGDVPRVLTRDGALAVRVLATRPGHVEVALVGRRSLLHAGDEVALRIELEPGTSLRVTEVAGTVAYDGRGGTAAWSADVVVGDGARLRWDAWPFVVAQGADVTRRTDVALGADAVARLRETLVLGRDGERGGRLRTRTDVSHAGVPLLVEDLDLTPALREEFGVLGDARVVDTVLELGCRGTGADLGPVEVYELDGPGTMWRWVGDALHRSPFGG